MDKLDHIFEMQEKLNNFIINNHNLCNKYNSEVWIQKNILALISELSEILDEVNFKWWKNPKAIDRQALKEELVDVLHFFVSMCLHAGMTAEELYQIYLDKNKENLNRQVGNSSQKDYRP
ncbi:MAG TPA: dUTPase [Clostridiales bacterium]|jgi:dimeric dUTPase (all-alpha-NTP-PPase superfamily)|nr:dUTPase [Clostridiales bacterium]